MKFRYTTLVVLCAMTAVSCGGSPAAPTVTATVTQSPATGAQVTYASQPLTLTVQNAAVTGGGSVSYTFEVATDSGFKPLPPHVLFQTHVNVATVNPPESLNHYDVSRDGNRFLISSRGISRAVPIVLVFDWRAVLTRR